MEKIYYNGVILTMEPDLSTEAVLVCNGLIKQTGRMEEVRAAAPNADLIDLAG